MVRPITDTLRALRNGHFIDEASEDLARIVNAVSETGKSGKLTIEITVKKLVEQLRAEIADTGVPMYFGEAAAI